MASDPASQRHDEGASMAWDHVAALYDSYVQVTFDVPFLLREATRTPGDVLELMAGTGRVSLPLLEAGVRLTCVDSSAAMLAVLREKLARRGLTATATVVQADVRALALDRQFDLVLIPFHSFAEVTAPEDQRQVLARVRAHLRDGGRFICTLHNPRVRLRSVDGQLHLLGAAALQDRPGRLLIWTLMRHQPPSHLVEGWQFYEEYDAEGVLQRKRLLETRFALIERDAFAAMAADAGFRVTALYGDYDGAPFDEETSPYMVWVMEA